jgi:hypothetical protein
MKEKAIKKNTLSITKNETYHVFFGQNDTLEVIGPPISFCIYVSSSTQVIADDKQLSFTCFLNGSFNRIMSKYY